MDFNSIPVVAAAKAKLDWLGQRQRVLAENIANADTPGFKARDLEPFQLADPGGNKVGHLAMRTTGEGHLPGRVQPVSTYREREERRPYETAPAGNAVVLEEQMGKISETATSHKLAVELYRKHLNMFRIAVGKGR